MTKSEGEGKIQNRGIQGKSTRRDGRINVKDATKKKRKEEGGMTKTVARKRND